MLLPLLSRSWSWCAVVKGKEEEEEMADGQGGVVVNIILTKRRRKVAKKRAAIHKIIHMLYRMIDVFLFFSGYNK
jgi:hypothetical protein